MEKNCKLLADSVAVLQELHDSRRENSRQIHKSLANLISQQDVRNQCLQDLSEHQDKKLEGLSAALLTVQNQAHTESETMQRSFQSQIQAMQSKYIEMSKALEVSRSRDNVATAELNRLRNEQRQLKEDNEALSNKLNGYEEAKAKLIRAKMALKSLRQQYDISQKALAKGQRGGAATRAEASARRRIEDLETENRRLKTLMAEMSQKKKDASAKRIRSLERETQSMRAQIQTLTSQLAQIRNTTESQKAPEALFHTANLGSQSSDFRMVVEKEMNRLENSVMTLPAFR